MKHMLLACLTGLVMLSSSAFAAGLESDPEVKKAESYMKNLRTAQAEFIQTSSLGSRLTGTFYLNRPGKLRFNYNEIKDFIVADGVFVYFYDSQLGSQTNAPVGQTLADFLLRSDLSFSGELQITNTYKKDGMLSITLVQKDEPGAGQVELFFTEVPFEIARWRVTDAQGEITEVTLKNLQRGVKFEDPNLFGYHDPKGRKRVND